MRSSAFSSLAKVRKERQGDVLDLTQEAEVSPPETTPPVKQGRPTGKRSSDEHMQVTAYIRKDTHKATKLVLLQSGDERDFSELVDDLLQAWLAQQNT